MPLFAFTPRKPDQEVLPAVRLKRLNWNRNEFHLCERFFQSGEAVGIKFVLGKDFALAIKIEADELYGFARQLVQERDQRLQQIGDLPTIHASHCAAVRMEKDSDSQPTPGLVPIPTINKRSDRIRRQSERQLLCVILGPSLKD